MRLGNFGVGRWEWKGLGWRSINKCARRMEEGLIYCCMCSECGPAVYVLLIRGGGAWRANYQTDIKDQFS